MDKKELELCFLNELIEEGKGDRIGDIPVPDSKIRPAWRRACPQMDFQKSPSPPSFSKAFSAKGKDRKKPAFPIFSLS